MTDEAMILRDAGWATALRERLGGSPPDLSAWMREHTRLLKSDASSEVSLLQLQDELCYLKFYRYKTPVHRWLSRRGRAVRCFDLSALLVDGGLSVPQPRACLRVPGGVLLLAEGIPQARDLGSINLQEINSAALLPAAGSLLARLHRQGFSHGDCKWRNLLWSPERGLYLVDLDGARQVASGHPRQVRDLARFTLDAEERDLGSAGFELFLDAYLSGVSWPREQVLGNMMPILGKLRARHLARYGQRGSRLIDP